MIWRTMSRSLVALTFTLVCWAASAQEIDWNKVQGEATVLHGSIQVA